MMAFFEQCDLDDNGMLDLDELQKMFANFNVIASKDDITTFFEKVDTDGDGMWPWGVLLYRAFI